jgi:hypothetical protein
VRFSGKDVPLTLLKDLIMLCKNDISGSVRERVISELKDKYPGTWVYDSVKDEYVHESGKAVVVLQCTSFTTGKRYTRLLVIRGDSFTE